MFINIFDSVDPEQLAEAAKTAVEQIANQLPFLDKLPFPGCADLSLGA